MRWRAAPAALVLLAAACGGSSDADPEGDPDAPLVSVRVDPGLSPRARELPGFEADRPRPLAAAAGVDGEAAVFVADELWVSTDDRGALDELLDRWGGEVVATLDPDELDLGALPPQYLVRVDASAADVARLGEHIRELDENVTGDYAVSSEQGRSLLAAAAEEAASGRAVGLNWVGQGTFSWTPIEALGSGLCGFAVLTIELEVTNPDGAVGTDSVDIDVMEIC